MRGRPECCVARFSSVIVLPLRDGTCTDAGRYFATGSSRRTEPSRTIDARMVAVNVLVTEPISNTVRSSSGTALPVEPAL